MITVINSLELGQHEVNQVLPNLKDVKSDLDRFPNLPKDNELFVQLNKWVSTISAMPFDRELSE